MGEEVLAIIDVAGVTIHCRDEGPRDAPAVLFANSLGSDFRIWDGVAASLVARWRVVRYDMRGHGLSGAPAGPYALEDQSRDEDGKDEVRAEDYVRQPGKKPDTDAEERKDDLIRRQPSR